MAVPNMLCVVCAFTTYLTYFCHEIHLRTFRVGQKGYLELAYPLGLRRTPCKRLDKCQSLVSIVGIDLRYAPQEVAKLLIALENIAQLELG